MKSHEFIEILSKELEVLPDDERLLALNYYEEYFSEAAGEERAVIKLGSPESVARNIISEYKNQFTSISPDKKEKAKKKLSDSNKILIIIILVLLSPVILPLAGAAVSVVVGVLAGVFGILIGIAAVVLALMLSGYAIAIAGVALSAASIFAFVSLSLADGLFILGTGIALVAVGLAFGILMTWAAVKVIPGLISWFVDLCKLPFKRRKNTV